MFDRPFWRERIERAWAEAPIVWLAGVRRAGKTTLATLVARDRALFLNCDLPVVSEMVAQPDLFFRGCQHEVIVFDEIHQLRDPSRILKIGADLFPGLKILATGSSTLAASRKFRDALTGRKRLVRLTPVLWDELPAFGQTAPLRRLAHGGLPEPLLAANWWAAFYREWIDSFFARDVQRLFAFRDHGKFTTLFEYVLKQSGGLFEASRASTAIGVSRPTIAAHLQALEAMQAITVVRPFYGHGRHELTKAPKIYGFDTGFVSFCRGWDPLRPDDYGVLWEHVMLEYLQAHAAPAAVHYWRDTGGRELDFVVALGRDQVDVIECKWNPAHVELAPLKVFRASYPHGRNYVVSPLDIEGYPRSIGGLDVYICNPTGWRKHAARSPA